MTGLLPMSLYESVLDTLCVHSPGRNCWFINKIYKHTTSCMLFSRIIIDFHPALYLADLQQVSMSRNPSSGTVTIPCSCSRHPQTLKGYPFPFTSQTLICSYFIDLLSHGFQFFTYKLGVISGILFILPNIPTFSPKSKIFNFSCKFR